MEAASGAINTARDVNTAVNQNLRPVKACARVGMDPPLKKSCADEAVPPNCPRVEAATTNARYSSGAIATNVVAAMSNPDQWKIR
jgi:hypothetical protein